MAKAKGKKPTGRPVGRPPHELTERIQLRLSPDEQADWAEVAAADHRTVASWLRALANRAVAEFRSTRRR